LAGDAIAKRAYELWEQAGKPAGQETEHWLQAEAEIMQRRESRSEPRRFAQQPDMILFR
jgi:Asp-tRNA(Asn)/Glu-tRNA(Gln) amidotransferase B subunit